MSRVNYYKSALNSQKDLTKYIGNGVKTSDDFLITWAMAIGYSFTRIFVNIFFMQKGASEAIFASLFIIEKNNPQTH